MEAISEEVVCSALVACWATGVREAVRQVWGRVQRVVCASVRQPGWDADALLHHAAASKRAIRRMLKAAAFQTIAQFIFRQPLNIGRRSRPYCFIQPIGPSTAGLLRTLAV